jgi:hypothetical protein
MQYCNSGPVWFGTLGVEDDPPSVAGLLRILPRSLGEIRPGPLGVAGGDECIHV